MAQARTAGKPGRVVPRSAPTSRPVSTDRLREHIAELLLQAGSFVPLARVEGTARGWLARTEPAAADPARELLLVADALGMAMDLALFTPSASGATAFDRLARRRGGMGADETAALDALRRAQFRLLRVEAAGGTVARMRDLVTDDVLPVLDDAIGAAGQSAWRWSDASRRWATAVTCLPAVRPRSTRPGSRWPPASSVLMDAGC